MVYHNGMKVYRYLGARELGEILAGNNNEIGSFFSRKVFRWSNSHRYKKDVKYLHFFQKKEDIEKIKMLRQKIDADFYVCEFDIPKKMMKKGIGRYNNARGYEHYVEKAVEYIVPSQEFDCGWLQGSELDQDHKTTETERSK